MPNLKCPHCGSYRTMPYREVGTHMTGTYAFLFSLATFGFGSVVFVPWWLISRTKAWYQYGHHCGICQYDWIMYPDGRSMAI